MYKKPESGKSFDQFYNLKLNLNYCYKHRIQSFFKEDPMARKPRNVRTERLTDWRFFYHIYLVIFSCSLGGNDKNSSSGIIL